MTEKRDEWISVKEAASIMEFTPWKVYELLKAEMITFKFISPPNRINRRKLVSKTSVIEYMEKYHSPVVAK